METLLLIFTLALVQVPPVPTPTPTPPPPLPAKAVLVGPAERSPGSLVIISTKGSVGYKFTFQCSPKNDEWRSVRFADDNGDAKELGIIFSTDKPGNYTFFLAVSDEKGLIASTVHTLTITDPAPKPKPPTPTPPTPTPIDPADAQTLTFYRAYHEDIKSVGEDKARIARDAIIKAYRNGAKLTATDTSLTQAQQIWTVIHNAIEATPESKGQLPNLRDAVAKFQAAQFPGLKKTAPLTPAMRQEIASVFIRSADYLQTLPDTFKYQGKD